MVKESLPSSKYPALLQLEGRRGIHVGFAYSTPEFTKLFASYIHVVKCQCQSFLNSLLTQFFSFLLHASVDVGNMEDESVMNQLCLSAVPCYI